MKLWPGVVLGASVVALAAPPVAEVLDVPTVHHGTTVHDPYRWLEDVRSPRAQAWMLAQGDATRALLDRIDQRGDIQSRLTEIRRSTGDSVRNLIRMPGGRLFYLSRPSRNQTGNTMTAGPMAG